MRSPQHPIPTPQHHPPTPPNPPPPRGEMWINISTFCVQAIQSAVPHHVFTHKQSTSKRRNPNKIRHLRDSPGVVSCCCRHGAKGLLRGRGIAADRFGLERRGRIGSANTHPVDPDDHASPGRWSQSRAPSTPTRRLGVQCERSVRDPIRIAAPARMNQAGWPSGLGMEAEASPCPPDRRNSQPVAGGRRTVAKALTSGNSCAGRPSQPSAGRPFLFSGPPFPSPPFTAGPPLSHGCRPARSLSSFPSWRLIA